MTETRKPAARKPSPAPRTETPAPAADRAVEAPKKAASCNLPGCDDAPEWRGLCSAHRQTHRGLADEKEKR
ncbi:hypothetical protein [Pseudonocardia sp. NPDC049154]|uniref:hypothetical protein n=1 Tax=Pseudonocardia sp. NPDC049154 TaxID=3155501 RepID=UPI0033E80F09